jgi:hypothetical protein
MWGTLYTNNDEVVIPLTVPTMIDLSKEIKSNSITKIQCGEGFTAFLNCKIY